MTRLAALCSFTLVAVIAASPLLDLLLPTARAQLEVSGPASVVDGDTIIVAGKHVRLFGIDAPESDQTCKLANGAPWPCGTAATIQLAAMLSGKTVRCFRQDTDRYGRMVAICNADHVDVGAAMVRMGLAIAYRRYSSLYVEDERAARLMRKGMWDGTFMEPEKWRHRR